MVLFRGLYERLEGGLEPPDLLTDAGIGLRKFLRRKTRQKPVQPVDPLGLFPQQIHKQLRRLPGLQPVVHLLGQPRRAVVQIGNLTQLFSSGCHHDRSPSPSPSGCSGGGRYAAGAP